MSTLFHALLDGIENGSIQMTWVLLACIVIPASLAAMLGVCVDAFRFAVTLIFSIPFFVHLAFFGKRMDKSAAMREYENILGVFLGQRINKTQLSFKEPVEKADDPKLYKSRRRIFDVFSHLFKRNNDGE